MHCSRLQLVFSPFFIFLLSLSRFSCFCFFDPFYHGMMMLQSPWFFSDIFLWQVGWPPLFQQSHKMILPFKKKKKKVPFLFQRVPMDNKGSEKSPTRRDILCGRGKGLLNHPGNQRFLEFLKANATSYIEAPTRVEKTIVIAAIFSYLQKEGIRFMKEDQKTRRYVELSEDKAREKIAHAMRDYIKRTTSLKSSSLKGGQEEEEEAEKSHSSATAYQRRNKRGKRRNDRRLRRVDSSKRLNRDEAGGKVSDYVSSHKSKSQGKKRGEHDDRRMAESNSVETVALPGNSMDDSTSSSVGSSSSFYFDEEFLMSSPLLDLALSENETMIPSSPPNVAFIDTDGILPAPAATKATASAVNQSVSNHVATLPDINRLDILVDINEELEAAIGSAKPKPRNRFVGGGGGRISSGSQDLPLQDRILSACELSTVFDDSNSSDSGSSGQKKMKARNL